MEFIEKHSSVRGKAVITVVCGKYKKEFQVTVWEKFLPDWVAGEYVNAPYTNSGKTGLSVDISTSGKRALSYPYTDQKGIKLVAGETLTVSCDDTYEVQNYYVIIPGNTDLQYTTVMHNGNPWMVVDPDAGGSTSTETPLLQCMKHLPYQTEFLLRWIHLHPDLLPPTDFRCA